MQLVELDLVIADSSTTIDQLKLEVVYPKDIVKQFTGDVLTKDFWNWWRVQEKSITIAIIADKDLESRMRNPKANMKSIATRAVWTSGLPHNALLCAKSITIATDKEKVVTVWNKL